MTWPSSGMQSARHKVERANMARALLLPPHAPAPVHLSKRPRADLSFRSELSRLLDFLFKQSPVRFAQSRLNFPGQHWHTPVQSSSSPDYAHCLSVSGYFDGFFSLSYPSLLRSVSPRVPVHWWDEMGRQQPHTTFLTSFCAFLFVHHCLGPYEISVVFHILDVRPWKSACSSSYGWANKYIYWSVQSTMTFTQYLFVVFFFFFLSSVESTFKWCPLTCSNNHAQMCYYWATLPSFFILSTEEHW